MRLALAILAGSGAIYVSWKSWYYDGDPLAAYITAGLGVVYSVVFLLDRRNKKKRHDRDSN